MFQDSSMLQHVFKNSFSIYLFLLIVRYCSIIQIYSILLFILLLVGNLFPPLLACMTMLWTFICKFLCGTMFLFLLGIYLGMDLLGHKITLFNIWKTAKLFSKVSVPLCIPTSNIWAFQFLHIFTGINYCLSFCL